MIQKKHRIPQLAAAALLLGGPACGDDDKGGTPGGSTSGVNVTSARIDAVAKAYCELAKKCDSDGFSEDYSSVSECADSLASDVDPAGATLTAAQKKCLDAFLDYYACYAQTACDEDGSETCADFYDAQVDACEALSGGVSTSGKRARRMRIPKP